MTRENTHCCVEAKMSVWHGAELKCGSLRNTSRIPESEKRFEKAGVGCSVAGYREDVPEKKGRLEAKPDP
jgi:hypothetical protein